MVDVGLALIIDFLTIIGLLKLVCVTTTLISSEERLKKGPLHFKVIRHTFKFHKKYTFRLEVLFSFM